ncbi:IS110 family transposase [Streptosporangium album]
MLRAVRLPEGMDGMTRFHELVAAFLPEAADPAQVLVCIETDQGPWVRALVAAGYQVYGVNPKQAARHRELVSLSGAKSDKADAHTLADMVRTRRHHLRQVAADSDLAEAIRVVSRAHQTLIWERTRHMLRLRHALRDFFPAALEAYRDLTLIGADTLELLAKAPDPVSAAKLTVAQVSAPLKRARRKGVDAKAAAIRDALRTQHLGQSAVVNTAYAATIRALVAILQTLNSQIKIMEGQVGAHFGQHPDTEIYLSQPGIGTVLGARVLAEFGDAAGRYASAKARKNYAATSPITRQSGKSKTVQARFVHNDRLVTRCTCKPGQRSCTIPVPAPTTTNSEHARSDTTPHSANSATASSVSSTDASRPVLPTTQKPPGPTATNTSQLDPLSSWGV